MTTQVCLAFNLEHPADNLKIDEKVLTANWIWTSAICQSEQQIKVVIRQFPRWCSVLSCTGKVLSTLDSYSLTIKKIKDV